MKRLLPALVLALLSFGVILHSEVSVVQLFNGDLALGGYMFKGDPSSLGGTLNITYVPAVKFSDKLSLLPTYYGAYRGTKDVQELAGGGTLFSHQVDNSLILKGIYQIDGQTKLKLKTSGRMTQLAETKDESLGNALFNYNKISGGMEAERSFDSALRRGLFGIEYFTVMFPNYKSLSDKYGAELGTDNAAKQGANLLDFSAVSGYLESDISFSEIFGRLNLSYSKKDFPDQNIVKLTGEFDQSKKRADSVMNFSALFEKKIKRSEDLFFTAQLAYGLDYLTSNQAHYDINTHDFVEGYYDYMDNSLTPYFGVTLAEKNIRLGVSLEIGRRDYSARPVQDEIGKYLTDKISINYITLGLSAKYPVAKNISLKALVNVRNNSSNMKYEKTYAYNFTSVNYFLGAGYEY